MFIDAQTWFDPPQDVKYDINEAWNEASKKLNKHSLMTMLTSTFKSKTLFQYHEKTIFDAIKYDSEILSNCTKFSIADVHKVCSF